MKFKIGIFGSGNNYKNLEELDLKVQQLGIELAKRNDEVVVITGGCSGLPYIVASEAAKGGVEVWGYSPVIGMDEQKLFTPKDDLSIYSKLVYVPKDVSFVNNLRVCMKYRNVLSTNECDAGIVISGKWGSLNEFTNLIDMQKTVGVLTGTGGISDELQELTEKIHKEGQGKVIFSDSPTELVNELFKSLSQ